MIEESRFALMNIEGWRQSWWPCNVFPWLYLMKQMGMYSRVSFYKISHGAQIEPLKNSLQYHSFLAKSDGPMMKEFLVMECLRYYSPLWGETSITTLHIFLTTFTYYSTRIC